MPVYLSLDTLLENLMPMLTKLVLASTREGNDAMAEYFASLKREIAQYQASRNIQAKPETKLDTHSREC